MGFEEGGGDGWVDGEGVVVEGGGQSRHALQTWTAGFEQMMHLLCIIFYFLAGRWEYRQ